MEWISVKDKLPAANTPVLVFYLTGRFRNPRQTVAIYFGGVEWLTTPEGIRFANTPTHLMPLPEPPQRG